jgi:hypothetical protein
MTGDLTIRNACGPRFGPVGPKRTMSRRCAANLSFCGEQDHRRQLAVGTGDVHRGFAEIWFVLAKSDQHPAFWLSQTSSGPAWDVGIMPNHGAHDEACAGRGFVIARQCLGKACKVVPAVAPSEARGASARRELRRPGRAAESAPAGAARGRGGLRLVAELEGASSKSRRI